VLSGDHWSGAKIGDGLRGYLAGTKGVRLFVCESFASWVWGWARERGARAAAVIDCEIHRLF